MTSAEKIYAIMIEADNVSFLSLQCATCLEEAFMQARIEYSKTNRGETLAGAKIGLFTIKTVKEITEESANFKKLVEGAPTTSKRVEVPPVATQKTARGSGIGAQVVKIEFPREKGKLTKNGLMKKIIETKDFDLFNKNIKKFTKEERDYLKSQLGK